METHDVPTTKAPGKNRQWLLDTRPAGKLTGKEFRWHEASVPQPADGQVLVRNLWLSVDPAQRIWMWRDSYFPKIPIGQVMVSFAVCQMLESRHPDFKAGDIGNRQLVEQGQSPSANRAATYGPCWSLAPAGHSAAAGM
jgi:NADPH-dependent curcumin reductase CurA